MTEENKKDADEFYEHIIKTNIKIDGVAAETIADGEKGKILQKNFIYSTQEDFSKFADHIVSLGISLSNKG